MSFKKLFYILPLRLRSIFKRSQVEQELTDELQYHLEMETEENLAKGLTCEEARRSALLAIGGIDQKKEECRDTRGLQWLDDGIRDLSYGFRFLRRNPGFTILAAMTLALGIGSATAIFSLVNATLLKKLPYKDAGRIIHVARIVPQTPDPQAWNSVEIEALKEQASSCNAIAQFYNLKAYLIRGTETPLLRQGAIVSDEFFSLMGVPTAVGRIPSAYETGSAEAPSIVISHDLFISGFGGNPDLIGQALRLDGMWRGNGLYILSGVMPASFQFPMKADFWLPMHKMEVGEIIARLAPDASIHQGKAEFNTVLARRNSPSKTKIESLREYLVGDVAISMFVLFGAVILVMLIVCINVANLLLLRNEKRRHEMIVRSALGATRLRLARQTLVESGMLALLGGTLGMLLAWWMIRLLPLFAPRGILREQYLPFDTQVLFFAIGATTLAGIIVAILPAVRQPWSNLAEAIKKSGGHEATGNRKIFQSVLVSLQIALTLTVLCGAGLMVRSFILMRGGYPGARNDQITKFEVHLNPRAYPSRFTVEDEKRSVQAFERIRRELEKVPGVKRAATTTQMPGDTRTGMIPLRSYPGQTSWHLLPTNTATITNVSPGYFEILGIPLLSGRTFTEADNSPNSPKVVILSQTLAKILFPGENPVGKIYDPMSNLRTRALSQVPVIIGVVGDIRNRGFRDASFPEVYSLHLNPFMASGARMINVVVEARGTTRLYGESIRAAMGRIDPEATVSGIMTMNEYIDSFRERDRFSVFLLSIFAIATLIIAAIGIYGVMSQSVEQQLREMAVRIALGATPWHVMRFVFLRGAAQILVGLAAGLLGSFFMSRTLQALLVQVKPYDPATLLSVLFLLLAVACIACYGPASRATKADPISVLRAE
jgi:predicted permease